MAERPPADGTAVRPPGPAWRRWLRRAWLAGLVLLLLLVVLAGSVLTIDLGPSLKARAEREGAKLIERPLHIGSLSVRLLTGRFVLEDILIEGLSPEDRPFFTAKRLEVSLPWWTIFGRELYVEAVELSDWRMLVETFPNDRHSFIKIPRGRSGDGPPRFVTTVQIVRATRGEFVYEDHHTPWSTVARNLDVTVTKLRDYRGEVRFSGGTVTVQDYKPMWANMFAQFRVDGSHIVLDRIDLETDGARSDVKGLIDLSRWPEQTYAVHSRVHFPRMKELFFADDDFTLSGEGTFEGTFHLFKGGRELRGRFASAVAGVNDFRFPDLRGSLAWLPHRFEVTEAHSAFLGGRTAFTYVMEPLGVPGTPAVARFDARYEGVDLAALTDFYEVRGIRLRGRARGQNLLEWPLGRFVERRGEGWVEAAAPDDVRLMTRELPESVREAHRSLGLPLGPFNPDPMLGYVPIGGALSYRFDRARLDIGEGWVATPETYVAFEGHTEWGERSELPFHVTSGDWQQGDRLLAGILTAFGSDTRAVPVGGFGTFDGVMLGAFRDPRIEGRFEGEHVRAWGVEWGSASADVVIEDAYVDVSRAVFTAGDARIDAQGRFSLGYPRADGGEELDARVRLVHWPVGDLRRAFELFDYPIDGQVSGEFHVYGRYQGPHGFGRMTIADLVAYGERFEMATAGLRFEGAGVRVDGIEAQKAAGRLTGAAYVGWDGSYSFNAEGRRMPLEEIAAVQVPQAPLSGTLQFTASGSGTFERPRYELRGRVDDLFVADEGIGQVTGRFTVRDQQLTIDLLEAASPRLTLSGSGRIALTPEADAELTFRFSDTSIDPYARAFRAGISPFTTAVASGTLRVMGELSNLDHLRADTVIEQLDLRLFDYLVTNDGPIRIGFEQQVLQVERLRLVGEGTQLEAFGEVRFKDDRIALRALGDANLGILQGFFRDIRSTGQAELQAEIRGSLSQPVAFGAATIANGRLREFSLPHAVEALTGRIEFDSEGVRLDGLTGRLGGGEVRFGGRIAFDGLSPSEFLVTATGTGMRIRYPEGFRSLVDADLALRGRVERPVLSGTVDVRSAVWSGALDTSGTGIFGVAGMGGAALPAPAAPAADAAIPLQFDIRIDAPSTLRIETRAARLVSSAELSLRGSYDRPLLFGRVEIERGEVLFEGNRYEVTHGTVDFANPARIEPFFDIEAETRARVPGQVYRVVFRVTGTPDQFGFDLTSDPPLAAVDILSLLFGDVRDPQDAELRALRTPNRTEEELIAARATRLLASPISSEVGRVVEEAFGVDTVQISPSFGELSTLQSARLNPSARLTIGKRISDRVYLTYARALSTSSRDQILLVEYNQSDRLSWVVSQNEDRTYAVDVRVRHVF
jgi:hypothetical protein